MKNIYQLTKEEVAAALDIEVYSAEELLNGTIKIKMKEVKEIADYKGVTVEEILGANQGFKVIGRK